MKTSEKIKKIIAIHFAFIQKDIDKWYKTVNILIDERRPRSPKQMIEDGEADKVLEFLEKVLG